MAIQAMNIAIKNNNLMRRTKRVKFKKTLGGYGKTEKQNTIYRKQHLNN